MIYRFGVRLVRLLSIVIWLVVNLCSLADAVAAPNCVVELPVYDAKGGRLDFRVTRVTPEGRDGPNLIALGSGGMESSGGRFSFTDRSLLGRVVRVTVENGRGGSLTRSILLNQCPQRTSLRFGSAETYGDFVFETLRGRLSGCSTQGDWWVRAMPMFGTSPSTSTLEGYVRSDGSFSLSGQMEGERHILIFGNGREVVKAIGFDVKIGRDNDVGVVDLRGLCPK